MKTMMEKEILNKRFEGRHEIGKTVADFVEGGIKHLQLDEDNTYKILLAVDEAVANIIDHAYEGKGGKIEIYLEDKANNLIIKIHDNGKPFDPAAVAEYKPEMQGENPGSRGRGLYLMKTMVDEVKFEFNPGVNILTLVKKL